LFWELIIGNLFFSQPKFAQNQFDMLKNYFKIALRILFRNKFYSIINIVGLAIGLSACIIIYLITSFELSYESFRPDKKRIFRVVADIDDYSSSGMAHLSMIARDGANTMRNQFSGIDKLAIFDSYYSKVNIESVSGTRKIFEKADVSKVPSDIIIAEPGYFEILKYDWLAGNESTALQTPFKVVLTESKARSYFGSLPFSEIIGKEVIYDDSLRVTVSGIVKDFPKNTDLIFRDFISFSTIGSSFLKNTSAFKEVSTPGTWRSSDFEQIFVKLSKGATAAQIEAQSASIVNKQKEHLAGSTDRKYSIHLQPLQDIHFNSDYGGDFYSRQASLPTLYALMGIAGFILIIASINFVNLSTAQSIKRAKEIGIRKVLGSKRTDLIVQFLAETFILTLLAILISLLIINPVLHLFKSLIPIGVTLNFADPSLLIFLLLMAIFTTGLAGFYPASVLSSLTAAESLKGKGSGIIGNKNYLRRILIIFQFMVSLTFITGALLVNKQIHFMLNKDLGFKKDAIINLNITVNSTDNQRDILAEKIRNLTGVERVTVCWGPPSVDRSTAQPLRRKDNHQTIFSQQRLGDENYAPLFGLKILAGHNLTLHHGSDSLTEFLISEAAAKSLGYKTPYDAVGQELQDGYIVKENFTILNQGPIVGVISDFHTQSLYSPEGPAHIIASTKYSNLVSVKLSTNDKIQENFKAALAGIQKIWSEIYPAEKFDYSFYDRDIASFYSKEQNAEQIINAATMVAIFLSCIGLFGLITYMAAQRTKEIGIRKVLGASVAGVAVMLAKEFILLIIIAMVIASPIAYYLIHQWLQGFAYRVNISWWLFVMAGMAAILIALVTISYQAVKAALANPVKSLRADG
jgi:putative ABC transport system permease protein